MRTQQTANVLLVDANHDEFSRVKDLFVTKLLADIPVQRGRWQTLDVSDSKAHATFELNNVIFCYSIPPTPHIAQKCIQPDLPWAEDHFQERIAGEPVNPPPSYKDWPHHHGDPDKHITGEVFDHTYPERFWPKWASVDSYISKEPQRGIRYPYGSLQDVVNLLRKEPFTRQAFLPIWHPEDTGATHGQRVPCSIGYHFLRRGIFLDCHYYIRSCDVTRHFTNDVYMAVRLVQWMRDNTVNQGYPLVGNLTMHISNLHMFQGDSWKR